MDEINQIWGAFFRGQLLLSTIVATIFIFVGLIIGLPFAIVMGILAGILEFLPSIGHGIWLVIASLLAFFLGSTWIPVPNWAFMLIVIGLHLIFEQFDLNYLIPRIVGRSVHLPPSGGYLWDCRWSHPGRSYWYSLGSTYNRLIASYRAVYLRQSI